MTKLIDNNIHYSKYFEINNNDINNFKYSNKILGNIKRKEIKPHTSNFELQKFKEEYNNFHNQELNTERLNFPKLNSNTIQTFKPFITERTPIQNYNRFYHSRNLTNTNNPIKILNIDENLNTLTKTDDSIKNKSNLSINRHHSRINSMHELNTNIRNNKFFRSHSLNIDYKNLLNQRNGNNLNYSKRRTVTFINHKTNDLQNEIDKSNSNSDIKYNGYIPNFKRVKKKSKSKQFIKRRVSKYLRQLSKISESDNSKVFLNPDKISLKKSISINQRKSIINEKEEIEKSKIKNIRKLSFDYSTKNVIKSFYDNNFFHKKTNFKNTSESEDSGDCHDSDKYIINSDPNEEKQTRKQSFFLKYIRSSINLSVSFNKTKKKLFKFEEQIKEEFYVINGNYSQYKIRLIDKIVDEYKKKMKDNENELYKNLEDRINKNKSNIEYINEIKKYKKLNKSILYYQKHIHSLLKKHTINLNQIFNYSFSNSYLLNNYLSLDISRLIFKEKYFNNLRENYFGSIFKNFSQKHLVLKRASIIEERGSIVSLISSINKMQFLTKKDSAFLLYFYQSDYEYNIVPGFFSVKLEDIKLRIKMNDLNNSFEYYPKQKKKGNDVLKKRSIKEIFFDENPFEKKIYKTEKFLLRNALLKNYFYNRGKRYAARRSTLKR